MTRKAPSAGMKVTTGDNIPVMQEGTGKVAGDSLAAESAREGGAFSANPGQEQGPQKRSQQPEAQSSQQQQQQQQQQHTARSGTHEGGTAANKATTLGLENQQMSRGDTEHGAVGQAAKASSSSSSQDSPGGGLPGQGAPAPTYVTSQYYRDPAGPHGKNLKEGGFEGSGTAGGPLPEPGSIDDPARAAVRDLATSTANQVPGAGHRQTEGGEGQTWYTPLGGDQQA